MHLITKRRLAVVVGVLAAAAVAGGAYAATQSSPANPRQAFLNDAANRLHVTPQQLKSALRGAFLDRLNAAVAAGRLTQAQANAIKQRMQRGLAPLGPGLRFGFHMHGFGPAAAFGPGFGPGRLAAAASYLGITRAQLLQQLTSGKSLAQVAQTHHKSTAGLKAAMLAAVQANLDKAVRAKLITAAQEQRILSHLPARLDAEIAGRGLAAPRMFRQFRGPRGFQGRIGPGNAPWPGHGPWPGPGMPGSVPVPPPQASPVY